MKDVFKEQLVKKSKSVKDRLIIAALLFLAFILSFFAFLFLQGMAIMVIGIMGFVLYYVFGMFNQEFEYIFTNGELDIDVIYNRARRKRRLSCDVKEAVCFAHSGNRNADNEFKNAEITLNYGSGTIGESTWFLLVNHKGKRAKVIFEPNENLLAAMRPFISPRKVFKKI